MKQKVLLITMALAISIGAWAQTTVATMKTAIKEGGTVRITVDWTGKGAITANGEVLTQTNSLVSVSVPVPANQIITLAATGNAQLTYLDCDGQKMPKDGNQLTKLDLSNCPDLTTLLCSCNQLTELDLSPCTGLTGLSCFQNQLTELDLSPCTGLKGLSCDDNQLTELDLSFLLNLVDMNCSNNQLTELGLSNYMDLIYMFCSGNQLTELNLSNCPALTYLYCHENQLTTLNIQNCTQLTDLWAYGQSISVSQSGGKYVNPISYTPKSGSEDIRINGSTYAKNAILPDPTDGTHLHSFTTDNTASSYGDEYAFSGTITLEDYTPSATVEIATMKTAKTEGTVSITVGWTGEGSITANGVELANNSSKVNSVLVPTNRTITLAATGTAKLTYLDCCCNELTELDLANCSELMSLICKGNQLIKLDTKTCQNLRSLSCGDNQLTTLNIQNCTQLVDMGALNQSISVSQSGGQYFNPVSYTPKSGTENIRINGTTYAKNAILPEPTDGNTLTFTTENTASREDEYAYSGIITLEGYTPPVEVEIATIKPATNITQSRARLNGSINPNGQKVAYLFQYGTSASTLNKTTKAETLPNQTGEQTVFADIDDLLPGTTYYYRLSVSHSGQTMESSSIASFTTLESSSPKGLCLNSDLSFGATTLTQGESYTFTTQIHNNGNTSWTGAFYLKVNNETVLDWYETIGSGYVKTLTGSYTPRTAGAKTVELFYQTNQTGSGILVEKNGRDNPMTINVSAAIPVTNLLLNNAMSFGVSELEEYNKYTFSTQIINKGNVTWTGAFYLKVNGIDIASWGNKTIEANKTLNLTGYYTPTVSGSKKVELFYQTNETGSGVLVGANQYSNPMTIRTKATVNPPVVITPTSPSIQISNVNPTEGDKIKITGNNFTSNKAVKLEFSNLSDLKTHNSNITANSSGSFSYEYNTAILGTGTISVMGFDSSLREYTKVSKIIVNAKEIASNKGNLELRSPDLWDGYFDLPCTINISWSDLLSKGNLNKYYVANPNKSGEFLYSYTIEYQTAPNGKWVKIPNGDISGSVSPETTFYARIGFEAIPADYLKMRVRDNYLPTNIVESSIFKSVYPNNLLDITLDWDNSFPHPKEGVIGVAADGVARIYVKISNKDKNIEAIAAKVIDPFHLEIEDPNFLGKLHPATITKYYNDEANWAKGTSLYRISAIDGEVWLWYVAPLDFTQSPNSPYYDKSQRTVDIVIDATLTGGKKVTESISVKIVRPPLIMAHGLGGDPSTWDNFRYTSLSNTNRTELYVKDTTLFKYTKAIKLGPSESYEYNAKLLLGLNENSLPENIRQMRNLGYASNQVDYICHSMGGCVLRTAIAMDSEYRDIKNYTQGFVHKAITINTPHNGSPLADFVTEIFPLLGGNIDTHIMTASYDKIQHFVQSVKSKGGTIDYYEATNALKNLQVKGKDGYRFGTTKIPHHLIAGDIDLDTESIKIYADAILSMPGFDIVDALLGIIGSYALVEIRCRTNDENLKLFLDLYIFKDAFGFQSNASKVISFLDSYFEYKGVPNHFNDGDFVVHLSSQLAGSPVIWNNNTVFKNKNFYDANHLEIYNRIDVGDSVRNLLNDSVKSNKFGKEILPNTNVRSSSSGNYNWDINSLTKTVERVFDKSHIEIISPLENSQFKVNDPIEIVYQLKDTENLMFLFYSFQNNSNLYFDKSSKQQLKFQISPDFIGEQKITVMAAYDYGNKTIQHIDTLIINVVTDEVVKDFRIDPFIANVFEGERYYPKMTAIYKTFLSNVPSNSNKLKINIDDPSVVIYDDILHCFIGIKQETTFASIEYEGIRDTIYFNVMQNTDDDPVTNIEDIPFSYKKGRSITASIYPNPVSDQIYINYNLSSPTDNISIGLFSFTGQMIKHWNLGKHNAGEYTFSANVIDLSPGFYFIKIRNNMEEWAAKIIKK